MTECERVGLPYGVYLYSYALTTQEAESEAAHMLRMISGRKPTVGVWIDMEDADGYKQKHGKPLDAANGSLYTQICRTFCDRIPGAGVYSSTSVLQHILAVGDLPVWVAQWGSQCTYSGAYRLWQYSNKGSVDGISGGVDSTLAVIICAEAVKMMGLPADYVTAVTMPCFGTTDRTKSNAIIVSEQLGATVRVIDIGESVMQHFKDIGHDPENRNVVYENSQARERTQILMDVANGFADGGIHVGTEDMSEFADGWCTYNGDHISMYDVNAGSTKTMVQMVVRYVAETTDDKVLAKALLDVLDTPVSPELLPPTRNGEIAQKSEDSVGPYNLQDFFLYYLVDHGFAPEKVLRLADIAYGDEFDHATLKKWLRSYCRRLFSQQFKRSCLQDGPTLNGFSFSPRTGFSMPSDGSDALYLATVDALK